MNRQFKKVEKKGLNKDPPDRPSRRCNSKNLRKLKSSNSLEQKISGCTRGKLWREIEDGPRQGWGQDGRLDHRISWLKNMI